MKSKNTYLKKKIPNLTKTIFALIFSVFSIYSAFCQNTISVPFNSGFVGDNTGNNSCSNSLYFSSLGWTNIQFSQSTNSSVFSAQGNDILGNVLITDAAGIEHTIPGYVKWRAPSGQVSSLVFSPTTNMVLATNVSGTQTYSVSTLTYLGLIFNGQTLTINQGQVNGNAATSGLLDELNSYLTDFPAISTSDYVVNEDDGSFQVNVTLSMSSGSEIRVNFTSADGTASNLFDYTSNSGLLIFSPGQTTKIITIYVLTDLLVESSEMCYINLTDAVNASITKSVASITILDNPPLPVELMDFSADCINGITVLNWQTVSEINSDYFVVEFLENNTWNEIEKIDAAGVSTTVLNYFVYDRNTEYDTKYYRLSQVDKDGKLMMYAPISINCSMEIEAPICYPNPSNDLVNIFLNEFTSCNKHIVEVIKLDGTIVLLQECVTSEQSNNISFSVKGLATGTYYINVYGNNTVSQTKLNIIN